MAFNFSSSLDASVQEVFNKWCNEVLSKIENTGVRFNYRLDDQRGENVLRLEFESTSFSEFASDDFQHGGIHFRYCDFIKVYLHFTNR